MEDGDGIMVWRISVRRDLVKTHWPLAERLSTDRNDCDRDDDRRDNFALDHYAQAATPVCPMVEGSRKHFETCGQAACVMPGIDWMIENHSPWPIETNFRLARAIRSERPATAARIAPKRFRMIFACIADLMQPSMQS